ncbi:(3S)-malyl-CoA thioesterase [Alphaproteobacteria bacterium SO-S41]|nr:(3S)-malyl-CoA thioesterase [Alphaproteobacteria bacterium SO-S41]
MTATLKPRRSALYMPGSNARALEKARTIDADTLILDLEDAVAPDAKAVARTQVAEAVAARGFGHREVVVRINALTTPWGHDDVKALAAVKPDAILVPKVGSGEECQALSAALDDAGAAPSVGLWIMFETPQAVLNAATIGAAGGRLACIVAGTNDLVKEFRGRHTPGREGLLPHLTLLLAAARAHGLAALDGVYNDIPNTAGFEAACLQGAALGFDGKTLIHPSQVEGANRAFAPDEKELADARKILAAFELPENRNKGVITVDGRMVELLHAEIARGVVAMADAIAARAG